MIGNLITFKIRIFFVNPSGSVSLLPSVILTFVRAYRVKDDKLFIWLLIPTDC